MKSTPFFSYVVMGDSMECLRCGNKDENYFYEDGQGIYCRKCIMFGRMDIGKPVPKTIVKKKVIPCDYHLNYPLTYKQKRAVQAIMYYLKNHQDVLVYAACGAGKTELTMEAIKSYLNQGKKVGFAIARRQVVLEIAQRMQEAFPMLKVVAVCEGHTHVSDGDLIVCTMHQLYRYHGWFDLLVMDEVDDFPYRGNEILARIAAYACVGEKLLLSATPDEEMKKLVQHGKLMMVELFSRPHGYPLIVPSVRQLPKAFQFIYLIYFLSHQRKRKIQTLVFVPTITLANQLHMGLKWLFKSAVFTSHTINKDELIDLFHQKKYECLFATTVLERGITIKGIDILILQADHPVFNEASLIQMIGRVGRKKEQPTGKGVFLCGRKNQDILNCVKAIQKMNESI